MRLRLRDRYLFLPGSLHIMIGYEQLFRELYNLGKVSSDVYSAYFFSLRNALWRDLNPDLPDDGQ